MRIVVDRDSLIDFWNRRFLDTKRFETEDSADAWKEEYNQVQTKIKTHADKVEYLDFLAGSSSADLPRPFKDVGFEILSNGERISYGFALSFSEPKILKSSSNTWSTYLKSRKNTFFPTSSNLTGYILDPDNRVNADITSKICEESGAETRVLSHGMFGSRIRKYQDFNELYLDVSELGVLTQYLIDYSFTRYHKEKNRKPQLPHIDITLGLRTFTEINSDFSM